MIQRATSSDTRTIQKAGERSVATRVKTPNVRIQARAARGASSCKRLFGGNRTLTALPGMAAHGQEQSLADLSIARDQRTVDQGSHACHLGGGLRQKGTGRYAVLSAVALQEIRLFRLRLCHPVRVIFGALGFVICRNVSIPILRCVGLLDPSAIGQRALEFR